MHSTSMSTLFLGAVLAATVSASVTCSAKDASIVQFQEDVARPVAFCSYWQSTKQGSNDNPLGNLTPAIITQICQCISAHPSIVTSASTSTTTSTAAHVTAVTKPCSPVDRNVTAVGHAFFDPLLFCKYYLSGTEKRTKSPVVSVGPAKLSSVCSCASATPSLLASAFRKDAASKKATTTKTSKATKKTTAKGGVVGESAIKKTTTKRSSSHTSTRKTSSTHKTTTTSKAASVPKSPSTARSGTTRKSSSTAKAATPTKTTTVKMTTKTTTTKSLATGSLPATATSQTASAATVPASTSVKGKMAAPSTVNKKSVKNLNPAKNNTLAYTGSSNSAFQASSDASFKYNTVNLAYSSLINAVTCSSSRTSMVVTFENATFAKQAYAYWAHQSSLLFITSATSCSSNGSEVFFLGTSMTSSSSTITIKGALKSLASVTSAYKVKFSTGSTAKTSTKSGHMHDASNSGLLGQLQRAINSLSSSKLVKTPWGSQTQLFHYVPSAMSIFSNLGFYEQLTEYDINSALLTGTIVSPQVSMYCLNCSVGGALGYSGTYASSATSTSLSVSLAGSLDFDFKVGINAFAPLITTVNIPIGQFALPSISTGGFLSVQPIVQVNLVGGITITGPGQVVLGSQVSWSNVNITLNSDATLASLSGEPSVSYPFSVDGLAAGDFTLAVQATIVLQYSGGSGSTSQVSLQDTRTIAGQSSSGSSGKCVGILWDSSYSYTDVATDSSSTNLLSSDSGSVNQICVDKNTDDVYTIASAFTGQYNTWPATTATSGYDWDSPGTTASGTWTESWGSSWTDDATSGSTTEAFTTFSFTDGTQTFSTDFGEQTQAPGADSGDNSGGWSGHHSQSHHTSSQQQPTTASVKSTTTPQKPTTTSQKPSTTSQKPSTTSTTTTTTTTTTTRSTTKTTTTTVPSTTTTTTTTTSTTTTVAPTSTPDSSSARTPPPAGCVPNEYTYLDSNGQLWQLNSSLGFSGDLGTVWAGSLADCINQCDGAGDNCVGATWIESGASYQYCYLSSQSGVSNPQTLVNLVGYSAVQLAGTSCISDEAPSCPGDGGSTFRSAGGNAYGLECAYQYTGGIVAYYDGALNLEDCLNACDYVTDCVAVSLAYGSELASTTCTMFSNTTGAAFSSNSGYSVDSGYLF